MPKYKWDSPQEWLTGKINATDDVSVLRSIMTSVIDRLDSDQIQDVFQSEMDKDGYFEPDLTDVISRLPREAVVRLLENASIQCYDSESNDVLRDALQVEYTAGNISAEDIEEAQS
jgi:hypothetical protein